MANLLAEEDCVNEAAVASVSSLSLSLSLLQSLLRRTGKNATCAKCVGLASGCGFAISAWLPTPLTNSGLGACAE